MTLGEEFSSKPALVNTVVKSCTRQHELYRSTGRSVPLRTSCWIPIWNKTLHKRDATVIQVVWNANSREERSSGPGTNLPVAAGWVVKDFRSMLTCTTGKILTFNQSFCLGGVLPAGGFRSS